MRGQRILRTRQVDELDLATGVYSILPGIAEDARQSNLRRKRADHLLTICVCGKTKTLHAKRCAACFRKKGGPARALSDYPNSLSEARIDLMKERAAGRLQSTWHVHAAGAPRPQPIRPRMVKTAAGWVRGKP